MDIKAPEGWVAQCDYVDRLGWVVFAKKTHATWAEQLGYVGHAREPYEDISRKAEARVAEYVQRGF